MWRLALLCMLNVALTVGLVGCSTPGRSPGSSTVTVAGVGANPEEAKRNAFRDAVQLAYGSLSLSERRVINDNLFEDDVSYASGVIETFQVLSARVDSKDNLYHIVISVTVSSTGLERRILSSQYSDNVNGKELASKMEIGRAQAQSEIDRYLNVRRLFEHFTNDFATSLFDVETGQLQTARNGAEIVNTLEVFVRLNPDFLVKLCAVSKEYQAARTSAVPLQYRDTSGVFWVATHKCSAHAEVERAHFGAMTASMNELHICLRLLDKNSRVIYKKPYAPESPWLIKTHYEPQRSPPGAYLDKRKSAIILLHGLWGNEMSINMQLPSVSDEIIRSTEKLTATLSTENGC